MKINVTADLHSDMYDGYCNYISSISIKNKSLDKYIYLDRINEIKTNGIKPNIIEYHRKKSKKFIKKLVDNTDEITDNLFILGDISNLNISSKETIDNLLKYWRDIYIIPGNHDFYFQNKDKNRYEDLKEHYEHNKKVHFVKDEIIELGDLRIGMNMMFYNLLNPEVYRDYVFFMNDFHHIPDDEGIRYYKEGVKYYNKVCNEIDVFMSHVPLLPSKRDKNTPNPMKETPYLNASVELKDSIYYISGHTHEYGEMNWGEVNGFSVSVGYPGENIYKNNTKIATIDI